jgi:hypothetical protein
LIDDRKEGGTNKHKSPVNNVNEGDDKFEFGESFEVFDVH